MLEEVANHNCDTPESPAPGSSGREGRSVCGQLGEWRGGAGCSLSVLTAHSTGKGTSATDC